MDILDVKPEIVAAADASCWADFYKIKLQQGVWDCSDRPYLIEPMQQPMLRRQGLAPEKQCVMKGTQLGFTERAVMIALHGMIYGHYPKGVLYLFPTNDDMREFSKSRFGPLIAANPSALGKYVKDTDTANLKKVGTAFLFLRGARLSNTSGDVTNKDSNRLRGISSDIVMYDEFDMMDDEVLMIAEGRLGDSEAGEQYFLSNPTIPGVGIAGLFEESDQRYWFRRCLRCGHEPPDGAAWDWFVEKKNGWICAEVQFPNNIEHDGKRGYIACRVCGKAVGIAPACWVPKEPQNSGTMWGYQISQLSSAKRDPHKILQQYTNPPNRDLGNVVRFKLGLPYISAEDRLTTAQIMGCCGIGQQLNSHHGPCAMGVDIRRHKNVVIGCRTSKNSWRILRVARVESLDEVLEMAYRFNVRIAVLDIRPYQDEVRRFQREAKFQSYLCQYSENSPVGAMFNDKTGVAKVNRTEVMDASHRMIVDGQIELPSDCPEVRQFALECSAVAKVEEVNKKTGSCVFRYRKMGTTPDDYRHALNYFVMAATSTHMPVVGGGFRTNRPRFAKNDYARC